MRILDKILARWQLMEPVFYAVASTHVFEYNQVMSCPLRVGKGRVEINEMLASDISEDQLEVLLKIEVIRIALHHPYERRPEFCSGALMTLASNLVIADNYPEFAKILPRPSDYGLPVGQNYEWYALSLYMLLKDQTTSGAGDDLASSGESPMEDASELWGEDYAGSASVDAVLSGLSMKGDGKGDDKGEDRVTIVSQSVNVQQLLYRLRTIVISSSASSERRFTRMRPSRRRDYEVMGMVRKETPKILLALDVSGSMHQPQLDKCLGVASSVGRVFKSGVDILFFDTEVRSVLPLRMALDEIVVPGGGGTDFQPPVDHALKGHYDALVFLTDGEGDAPVFPSFFSSHILWCCVADSKPFMSQFSVFKI